MIRRFLSAILVLLTVFSVGTSALAAETANDRAMHEFMEEVAKLQPFLTIDSEGFFQVSARSAREAGISMQTFGVVKAQFAQINAELRKMSQTERQQMFQPGSDTDGDMHAQWCAWVWVPKWALQAFAWFVIIAGGVSATLSLFASGTIVGLPAGAVLGALGIWLGLTGSALLWYADNFYTDRYVFVCW